MVGLEDRAQPISLRIGRKGKAPHRPEERPRTAPHMVEDQVSHHSQSDGQEPQPSVFQVNKDARQKYDQRKKQGMGEDAPVVAEESLQEVDVQGLINGVRQDGTDHPEPEVQLNRPGPGSQLRPGDRLGRRFRRPFLKDLIDHQADAKGDADMSQRQHASIAHPSANFEVQRGQAGSKPDKPLLGMGFEYVNKEASGYLKGRCHFMSTSLAEGRRPQGEKGLPGG
jgi:hypothetical protein